MRLQIADEAKRYLDEGLLIVEIAEKMGYIRDTIREALRYWHQQHGLPMPDMRNRSKKLTVKNRPREKQPE